MTGWLIVNEYLNTEKFLELQELFMDAAKETSVRLLRYTNADFVVRCDNGTVLSEAFCDGEPDFIIFYDKDIVLARAFEKMGLKVFNSSRAIEICDSKEMTYEAINNSYLHSDIKIDDLGGNSENQKLDYIRIPATFKIPFTFENIGIKDSASFKFLDEIEKEISYPMIIKESFSSFGMGVHLAHDRKEAIELICKYGNKECLIQEYVASGSAAGNRIIEGQDEYVENGKKQESSQDIRIQMVGDKCVAAMIRKNDNDFRANLTNGGVMDNYEPGEEELDIARNVMKQIGLDFAGIDIMFDESGKPFFCEANSNAHFKNLYDLTGINTATYIIKYIMSRI